MIGLFRKIEEGVKLFSQPLFCCTVCTGAVRGHKKRRRMSVMGYENAPLAQLKKLH